MRVTKVFDAMRWQREIRRTLEEENPQALLADGFDAALAGVARRCGKPPLAAYSVSKCIEVLVGRGMTEEEATEYFDFNVAGAWMGEGTPVFIWEQP